MASSSYWDFMVQLTPQPISRLIEWGINQVMWIWAYITRPQIGQDEMDFKPQSSNLTGFIRKKGWRAIVFLFRWLKPIRFYVMVHSNDINCHKEILKSLGISPQHQVMSVDQSDVIIAFVPIVSRAGTDIKAALQKIPENRPVVFVVLHHTFDPNHIAPESNQAVHRSNVSAVDFLFQEDQGILKNSPRNTKALEATVKKLQDIESQRVSTFFYRK